MSTQKVAQIRRTLAEAPPRSLARLIATYESDPRPGVRGAVQSARSRLARHQREVRRLSSLYRCERRLRQDGYLVVAGIDEVGRGALAGPVTAAAVVLPEAPRIAGLDDSKRLSPERREVLAREILATAVSTSVAHVAAQDIDRLGIAGAVRRAMSIALADLEVAPDHVLVDGLPVGVSSAETAIVKGDSTVAAIAAASILAKVARDSLMCSIASDYPEYAFEVNKGYGTSEHFSAINIHGLCSIHRRSFAPCGGTLPLF